MTITTQRVQAILKRAGYQLSRLSEDRTHFTQGVQVWKSARIIDGQQEPFIAIHYQCTMLVSECPFGNDWRTCDEHGDMIEQQCLDLLAAAGMPVGTEVRRFQERGEAP